MIRAVVASVWERNSRNSSSIAWISSSINCGSVVDMSCVLRGSLTNELMQQHARNHVERFKHSLALVRGGGERRDLNFTVVQEKFHVFNGRDVWEIAFVVLNDVRNIMQVQLESLEVLFKVGKGFNVLSHLVVLGVSNKNDAVNATENELAGGVVDDLPGHSVELELRFETFDRHGFDGKEV